MSCAAPGAGIPAAKSARRPSLKRSLHRQGGIRPRAAALRDKHYPETNVLKRVLDQAREDAFLAGDPRLLADVQLHGAEPVPALDRDQTRQGIAGRPVDLADPR